MMQALCVAPELVERAWPLAEKYIRDAVSRVGISDVSQIAGSLSSGHALLWLVCEEKTVVGALVSQLFDEPNGRVCEIVAWGSDNHKKCIPLLSELYDYAKAEGCRATRLIGRKGWAKSLQDYKIKALIMERPL